jgi:EAL domain-containing protein (putative c-di-GMP-specific phosphodiesterase class I)
MPFGIDGNELYVSPSIGVSVFPDDGMSASDLVRNCDSAVYQASEIGGNNFQFYDKAMNSTAFEKLTLENTIRKGLEREEFVVYYQPLVNLKTGKIAKVEALVRWKHPDLGMVSPKEFIPAAEETGLIIKLGEWVLRSAMLEVRQWHVQGHKNLHLAVNVSGRQFRQRKFLRMVHGLVKDTRFDAQKLELELTESTIINPSQQTISDLYQLKNDGMRLVLDVFNTGFSSLNYLKTLPIDAIKIEKDYVKGVPSNDRDSVIADTIINLARSLRIDSAAEGIERLDQLQFLMRHGCTLGQGYYFSPPVPGEKMLEMLLSGQNWASQMGEDKTQRVRHHKILSDVEQQKIPL